MQMVGIANFNIYNVIPNTLKQNGDTISFNSLIGRTDWWVDKIDTNKKPILMTVFTKASNISAIYDSLHKVESLDGEMSKILDDALL